MRKEVTHCRKVLICKRCLYDLNLKQDGGYFRPITFRNLFQLVLIKIKLLNLESLYILLPYLRTSNPANLKFSKNKPPKGVWKVKISWAYFSRFCTLFKSSSRTHLDQGRSSPTYKIKRADLRFSKHSKNILVIEKNRHFKKVRLRCRCTPGSYQKVFRIAFSQNHSGRLLLPRRSFLKAFMFSKYLYRYQNLSVQFMKMNNNGWKVWI